MSAWVLHVDLDQFLAAVEVLRRPELAGRPVVVGGAGDPTQRSVVATASYEARAFGVRSGMPMRLAAKRCPEAVFLPSDHDAYDRASERVMAVLRSFAAIPVVLEVLGWDEAFLGVETGDPVALARQAQQAVLATTGLWCSVGIGDNVLRAKMATDFGKPRGVFTLTSANWFDVLGDRPTDALWGIGRKTAAKLAALGLATVAELAVADPKELGAQVGPTMGPRYVGLARGQARTEVIGVPYVPRARSREITFQEDLVDRTAVRLAIGELAGQVGADVLDEGRPAVRVGLKVRFKPFLTTTRSATLREPTWDPAVISATALTLFDELDTTATDSIGNRADVPANRPIRLLGVRAEFAPGDGSAPANPSRGRGGLGGDAR